MQEIYFCTGNKGKIAYLRQALSPYEITVMQAELELVEPQFDHVADIAVYKAKQAFEKLQKPVVVEDSGLCIHALNGFPGPYTKYVSDHLKPEHIAKMMVEEEDRTAHFQAMLIYIDENGKDHKFEEKIPASICTEVDQNPLHPDAWSPLWRILSVTDCGQSINALTDQQRDYLYKKRAETSRFAKLGTFLNDKYNLKSAI